MPINTGIFNLVDSAVERALHASLLWRIGVVHASRLDALVIVDREREWREG